MQAKVSSKPSNLLDDYLKHSPTKLTLRTTVPISTENRLSKRLKRHHKAASAPIFFTLKIPDTIVLHVTIATYPCISTQSVPFS